MRKRIAVVSAALLLGFLGTTLVPVESAEARFPRCWICAEGTLNLTTANCPLPATNCTECLLCG